MSKKNSIFSVNLGGKRNSKLGWPKIDVGKETGTSLGLSFPKMKRSRGGWGRRRSKKWW